MTKKKIVFVDDEPNILDGLRRMLRSLRNEYDMFFVSGGREALDLMSTGRFDVVISDMRMPGMDGAQLLQTIQSEHPHTIRIMLTGQADEQSILRTVGVVHQFLAKPCDPEKLKSILFKTSALQDILTDGRLKDLISRIGNLPSLPTTFSKLQKALASPDAEVSAIAEIIEQDIAMSAKILQLVNSAFFGLFTRVESPGRAVKLLGLETVKMLVLGLEIFSQASIPKDILNIDVLWRHSLQVGKLAKAIAQNETEDKDLISDAFLSGMLHDIGKLVLVSHLPDRYREVMETAREKMIPLSEAEIAVLGACHSDIGAYLIGLWGFTGPVIEAIGFHHRLEKYPSDLFSPALAVHIADYIYYRHHRNEAIGSEHSLNCEVIDKLGLADKMDQWEQLSSDIEG
jgi:HD-like signal output (HDOD) protein